MVIEVLYNPGAGREADRLLEKLQTWFAAAQLHYTDVTAAADYAQLYALKEEDCVIVAGGDGTLHHFVNAVEVSALLCDVRYYPIGSGNDFAHDLGHEKGCEPFSVKAMLCDLPVFIVDGAERRFINGVGVGLDGYVCRVGNERHKRTGKPVNYTLVAIKSLLGGYKPVSACVTVDGVRREYKKVWLVSTMHGRYFGGGMMIAPQQDRKNREKTETALVYFGKGKLFTMYIFPGIFKGKHVKYKKNVILRQGREISVELDRPCDLQMDGEVMTNVTSYTVRTVK